MWPSTDQIDALNRLINSKGFISSAMAVIVGLVVWQLLIPLTTSMTVLPGKADDILKGVHIVAEKLDQCLRRDRLADGERHHAPN